MWVIRNVSQGAYAPPRTVSISWDNSKLVILHLIGDFDKKYIYPDEGE